MRKRVCTRICKILVDSITIFYFIWKLFSVYFNELSENCCRTWLLCCPAQRMVTCAVWGRGLWTMTGSLVWLVKNLSFCVSAFSKLRNVVSQVLYTWDFINGAALASCATEGIERTYIVIRLCVAYLREKKKCSCASWWGYNSLVILVQSEVRGPVLEIMFENKNNINTTKMLWY